MQAGKAAEVGRVNDKTSRRSREGMTNSIYYLILFSSLSSKFVVKILSKPELQLRHQPRQLGDPLDVPWRLASLKYSFDPNHHGNCKIRGSLDLISYHSSWSSTAKTTSSPHLHSSTSHFTWLNGLRLSSRGQPQQHDSKTTYNSLNFNITRAVVTCYMHSLVPSTSTGKRQVQLLYILSPISTASPGTPDKQTSTIPQLFVCPVLIWYNTCSNSHCTTELHHNLLPEYEFVQICLIF